MQAGIVLDADDPELPNEELGKGLRDTEAQPLRQFHQSAMLYDGISATFDRLKFPVIHARWQYRWSGDPSGTSSARW